MVFDVKHMTEGWAERKYGKEENIQLNADIKLLSVCTHDETNIWFRRFAVKFELKVAPVDTECPPKTQVLSNMSPGNCIALL